MKPGLTYIYIYFISTCNSFIKCIEGCSSDSNIHKDNNIIIWDIHNYGSQLIYTIKSEHCLFWNPDQISTVYIGSQRRNYNIYNAIHTLRQLFIRYNKIVPFSLSSISYNFIYSSLSRCSWCNDTGCKAPLSIHITLLLGSLMKILLMKAPLYSWQ